MVNVWYLNDICVWQVYRHWLYMQKELSPYLVWLQFYYLLNIDMQVVKSVIKG